MSTKSTLKPLVFTHNFEGNKRRIGVEIEMSGLGVDELAQIVAKHFNLTVKTDGRYERLLKGDTAGDWKVELDFDLLKRWGRQERLGDSFMDELDASLEQTLKTLSEQIVPLELVSPPIEMDRLVEVESLVEQLTKAGAEGTSDRWRNAFGMQFNPEMPSLDAQMIVRFLKAFLCLYDWLEKRADINFTRKITSYVDPFPRAYVLKVIAPDYWPNQDQLIDDYLSYNPTRNRALDMLPLFRFLDESRVLGIADDVLIKSRPALHYRLPDSEIGQPSWGIHQAWNDWLEVEKLVFDSARLERVCETYQIFLAHPIERFVKNWDEQVVAFLAEDR